MFVENKSKQKCLAYYDSRDLYDIHNNDEISTTTTKFSQVFQQYHSSSLQAPIFSRTTITVKMSGFTSILDLPVLLRPTPLLLCPLLLPAVPRSRSRSRKRFLKNLLLQTLPSLSTRSQKTALKSAFLLQAVPSAQPNKHALSNAWISTWQPGTLFLVPTFPESNRHQPKDFNE